MSGYGKVTNRAVALACRGKYAVDAWKAAAAKVFPSQPASRDKGCPKCAFLGLAQEGVIRQVPPGNYTKSRDNKRYALLAVKALRADPSLANDVSKLWQRVMAGQKKQHNQQMDVVVALWKGGHIAGE